MATRLGNSIAGLGHTGEFIKFLQPWVARIEYKNGMVLFVDSNPRNGYDHYILYTSKGGQIFCRCLTKLLPGYPNE